MNRPKYFDGIIFFKTHENQFVTSFQSITSLILMRQNNFVPSLKYFDGIIFFKTHENQFATSFQSITSLILMSQNNFVPSLKNKSIKSYQ